MTWIWWLLGIGYTAMLAGLVVSVLRRRTSPPGMLAWILSILTVPVIGPAVYLLFGSNRIRRKASRRRRRVAHVIAKLKAQAEERSAADRAPLSAIAADFGAVEEIGRSLVGIPAVDGNRVQVLTDANSTYAALIEAIQAAKHHVHLLYYIWNADDTGHYFRDLVIRAARRGVECRILLDAVGCFKLRSDFLQPLRDAGVDVRFFLPLKLLARRRWSLHLRNHRKIAVIDGRVAFTGSQNIGDEYRGRLAKLSPWYDSHLRVEGPAAHFLQQTFAEDWVFAGGDSLAGAEYFPEAGRCGSTFVQILPTGPDQDVSVLGQVMFAAVSAARESVRIETPYFVPGPGLMSALTHAGYRGVRVQLIVPTRTDAPVVLWAGRSFYGELITAGVEVYEYDHAVLHSKIVTIDDRWCKVGSANMDVRSFRLNFEITALIYDERVAGHLSSLIEAHCSAARRIGPREVFGQPLRRQLVEGAARLLTPLL